MLTSVLFTSREETAPHFGEVSQYNHYIECPPPPGFMHDKVVMSGGMFGILTSVKKSNVGHCQGTSQPSLNTYATNILFFAKKH